MDIFNHRQRCHGTQSEGDGRTFPAGRDDRCLRSQRLRKVLPCRRHPLPGAVSEDQSDGGASGHLQRPGGQSRQDHQDRICRPESDREEQPLQCRDLPESVRRHPQASGRPAICQDQRLHTFLLLLQPGRRTLPGVPGRRFRQDSDAVHGRCHYGLRILRRKAFQA